MGSIWVNSGDLHVKIIYIYAYLFNGDKLMFFIFISTVISWCSDIYSKQQYDRDGQLIATEPCLTPPFAWWWVVYFRLVNYYKHMQRLWVARPLFAMYRPTSLQYLQALVSSNVLGSLPGSLPSEVGTAVYSMGPWNLFSSNIHQEAAAWLFKLEALYGLELINQLAAQMAASLWCWSVR